MGLFSYLIAFQWRASGMWLYPWYFLGRQFSSGNAWGNAGIWGPFNPSGPVAVCAWSVRVDCFL